MAKAILNDLAELMEAGLLSQESADNINAYYRNKYGSSQNRMFVVFGLLGAILVGLGIILIIAHNWDSLSRQVKTVFAFLPIMIGQLACIYVLLKKYFSQTWRESTAAFLFLAIGASISLVSQVYHIPGNISSFIITWMLLCLPLVYIMNSGIASLMYLAGISYFAVESGYWAHNDNEDYKYWFLLALLLPYYYKLVTKYTASNFTIVNNWFIVLSVIVALGTIAKSTEEFMFLAYIALFSVIYTLQDARIFRTRRQSGEFYAIGSLGIVAVLLILSFDWFWNNIYKQQFAFTEIISAPEVLASALLLLLATFLTYNQNKSRNLENIDAVGLAFIPFTAIFFTGMYAPQLAVIATNLIVLALGVLQIRQGARTDHLGVLNYGLLIITALVICRFFDTDLSFVIRGILFLTVGTGFFAINYRMIKKRSIHEQ